MKRQFKENSGVAGFTRDDGTFQCTGSAMGRRSNRPHEITGKAKLRVRRVRLDSGGYDDGGAYWGSGPGTLPLWEARGEDAEQRLSFFTRAGSRRDAVESLTAEIRRYAMVEWKGQIQ